MGWCTTSDLDRFAAAAGDYLRSRAAENTLLLSAAQTAQAAVRAGGHARPGSPAAAAVLYGWWEPPDGGEPRGAFLHDPSVPLLISGRVPEMAAALAAALAKSGRPVCGVDAPTEAADAFAAAWSQRARLSVRVHRYSRVYRLTGPGAAGAAGGGWPPPEIPGPVGRLRVATPADQPLLAAWLTAFAAETAERTGPPSDLAADLISYGGAVFLDVPPRAARLREAAPFGEPACQPVALATLTRPVAAMVRIGIVYTPPECRRSGYAAALTHGVSRAVLTGDILGAAPGHRCVSEVVMITDRNRSDRWGGRIGYQLIDERAVLRFGPPTGPHPRIFTGPLPRLPTGPLPRLPRPRR
jgi:hypothetical protein